MHKKLFKTLAFISALACSFSGYTKNFHLEDIQVRSQGSVNPSKLKDILKGFIGKNISADLLQQIINEVSDYYRENGYPGSLAVIPEQTISRGILNVEVITPHLNRVIIINDRNYLRKSAEERLFYKLKTLEDNALNLDDISSYLLKLSDLGSFDLKAEFNTDNKNYLDNLHINVQPKNKIDFLAFSDNHGTKASGKYRFGGVIKVNSLTSNADNLSLFYARSSQKQNNYSVTYEFPLNSHPTIVGIIICLSDYELGKEYAALGAKGTAQTYEMYLKEPVHRSNETKIDFLLGARYRDLKDEFSNFDLKFNKHSTAAYGTLTFEHKNERFFLSGFAKATLGRLYADDDYNVINDGSFVIGNFGINAGYRFNEVTAVELRNELQLASTALEGSEQFLASGADAVTAYDPSAVSGDCGALSSLSLAISPFKNFDLSFKPHLDAAAVKSRNFKYVDIYGAGLSAELKYHGFFSSLDLSTVIGKKPYEDSDDGQIFFRIGYDFFN